MIGHGSNASLYWTYLLFLSMAPLAISLLGFSSEVQGGTDPDDAAKYVKEARFSFIGTVQRTKATTLDVVPASERTAVVKIDEILQKPQALGDYKGQAITVVLSKPNSVQAGQQWLFFTNGGITGQGLAVNEVGHANVQNAAWVRQAYGGKTSSPDLRSRLAKADVVFVGKVLKLNPPKAAAPDKGPRSEHDPQWREVICQVDSVEKGKLPEDANTISILVPTSKDVMWYKAPRPQVGEERIWLLRQRLVEGVRAFTATDQFDYLPREELPRVQDLMK